MNLISLLKQEAEMIKNLTFHAMSDITRLFISFVHQILTYSSKNYSIHYWNLFNQHYSDDICIKYVNTLDELSDMSEKNYIWILLELSQKNIDNIFEKISHNIKMIEYFEMHENELINRYNNNLREIFRNLRKINYHIDHKLITNFFNYKKTQINLSSPLNDTCLSNQTFTKTTGKDGGKSFDFVIVKRNSRPEIDTISNFQKFKGWGNSPSRSPRRSGKQNDLLKSISTSSSNLKPKGNYNKYDKLKKCLEKSKETLKNIKINFKMIKSFNEVLNNNFSETYSPSISNDSSICLEYDQRITFGGNKSINNNQEIKRVISTRRVSDRSIFSKNRQNQLNLPLYDANKDNLFGEQTNINIEKFQNFYNISHNENIGKEKNNSNYEDSLEKEEDEKSIKEESKSPKLIKNKKISFVDTKMIISLNSPEEISPLNNSSKPNEIIEDKNNSEILYNNFMNEKFREYDKKPSLKNKLDDQVWICYQCHKGPFKSSFFSYFWNSVFRCPYNGYWYCKDCMADENRIIPWMALDNDFTKMPISKQAEPILKELYEIPNLYISSEDKIIKENTNLYISLILKRQINLMYDFICDVDFMKNNLGEYYNFAFNTDILSLKNLYEIHNGVLNPILENIIKVVVKHVNDCKEFCYKKGVICEICKNPEKIFNFDIRNITICEDKNCKKIFHKKCFEKNKVCICKLKN